MQNLDLKTFPHEVREGIKEIYEDDVKKYRVTVMIAKKYFQPEVEAGTLMCPICGNPIKKIATIHAKVHDFAKKETGYWAKDNMVPMCSKACHEKDDLENYRVNGKIYTFSKSATGKDYREQMKDPSKV